MPKEFNRKGALILQWSIQMKLKFKSQFLNSEISQVNLIMHNMIHRKFVVDIQHLKFYKKKLIRIQGLDLITHKKCVFTIKLWDQRITKCLVIQRCLCLILNGTLTNFVVFLGLKVFDFKYIFAEKPNLKIISFQNKKRN